MIYFIRASSDFILRTSHLKLPLGDGHQLRSYLCFRQIRLSASITRSHFTGVSFHQKRRPQAVAASPNQCSHCHPQPPPSVIVSHQFPLLSFSLDRLGLASLPNINPFAQDTSWPLDYTAVFDPPLSVDGFPLRLAWHKRRSTDVAVQHVARLIIDIFGSRTARTSVDS